jgi:hypothetical protein
LSHNDNDVGAVGSPSICLRLVGTVLLSLALAACGGGGGSDNDGTGPTLRVELAYTSLSDNYEVWVPVESQATLNGLDGHTPQCTVSSGSLPDGVRIDSSTCAVGGTPKETGTWVFTTRLTVSGFSGYVEASGTLRVVGPYLAYGFGPEGVAWGEAFQSAEPSYGNFRPSTADQVTYRLGADAPDWVSIDASTGILSGTPRDAAGTFEFTVFADIVHEGMSATAQSSLFSVLVNYPGIYYPSDNSGTTGVALSIDPQIPTGFETGYTLAFQVDPSLTSCELPTGLTVDANTGRISGTPTQAAFECDVAVAWTATGSAVEFQSFDIVQLTIH